MVVIFILGRLQELSYIWLPEYTNDISAYLSSKGYNIIENPMMMFYRNGYDMFMGLINDINKAKHIVIVSMFSIKPCRYAKILLQSLHDAEERGVYVKLWVDILGTSALIRPKGMNIEFYRPYLDGLLSTRLHDKISIIDNKIIHISSYVIRKYSIEKWIENGVRIEYEGNDDVGKEFIDSMQKEAFITREAYLHRTICIPFWVSKYQNRGLYANLYLNMILNAKKRIYILNPYFVPPKEIENALVERSAEITIYLLVLSKGDHPIINATAKCVLQRIAQNSENRIHIYEYPFSHVHSKIMLADDDITLIGSGNMDYRSLFDMHETGAFIIDKKLHTEIENYTKSLIKSSVKADLKSMFGELLKHTVEQNEIYRNVL